MSYQVILARGSHTEVYGTYPTRAEAEAQAAIHRSLGYWVATIVAAD